MARPNERGLELTFHKPTKRWRKRIDGDDHWFGSGRGVSDRVSYRKALKRYRAFMDRREQAIEAADRGIEVQQASPLGELSPEGIGYLLALAKVADPSIDTSALDKKNPFLRPEQIVKLSDEDSFRLRATYTHTVATHPKAQVRENRPAEPHGKTPMDTVLDNFIREQEHRHKLTLNAPDSIHRNQRLGSSALRQIKHSIEFLRTALREANITDLDEPGVEKALADYRSQLDKRVAAGTMTGQSVDGRLKAVRPLFEWAWRNRHINDQPRNLHSVLAKHARASTAKPVDLAVIRKLWESADDRMRTFMALALNCGFYAMDISTLKPEHITDDGYIARLRHKTTVPTKFKLWPITQQLIQKTRDDRRGGDTKGLLFIRRKRTGLLPWVHEKPNGNGKYDALAREFKKLRDDVGVKVAWSQLRDTGAHWIEHYAMNGDGANDPTLVSHFLGHSDTRMAKLYLQQDPAKLNRPKLDAAIDWWGEQLKLPK